MLLFLAAVLPNLRIPVPRADLVELGNPLERHGGRFVAIFPPLALGPLREGPVVLGGNLAVPVSGLKCHQHVILVVPGSLEAVPDELEVVEFLDLRGTKLLVLEVVSLALDPPTELLVGVAPEYVRMAVGLVELDEPVVVVIPGVLDNPGLFVDDVFDGEFLDVVTELDFIEQEGGGGRLEALLLGGTGGVYGDVAAVVVLLVGASLGDLVNSIAALVLVVPLFR